MFRSSLVAGIELALPLIEQCERGSGVADLIAEIIGNSAISVDIEKVMAQAAGKRLQPRAVELESREFSFMTEVIPDFILDLTEVHPRGRRERSATDLRRCRQAGGIFDSVGRFALHTARLRSG